MKFRTELTAERAPFRIDHKTAILTIGSCFSDEIGSRLQQRLFKLIANPFGAMFNPSSIKAVMEDVGEGKVYQPEDIYLGADAIYHSHLHHSKFSSPEEKKILSSINKTHQKVREFIANDNLVVMLTLGSARAFRHIASGLIVANCHKQPAKEFEVVDLSIDDIVDNLMSIIRLILKINGNTHFVLTVSPVRHVAYGLHADRISKSKLLVATDIVERTLPDIAAYFPAYELLVDDLRDYRFYSDDLVHPSAMGADYVYRHFESTFMDQAEVEFCRVCHKLYKLLNHRPIVETELIRDNSAEQIAILRDRIASVYPSIVENL